MIEPHKIPTRCFSCDGRVIWKKTRDGKKMPVNADPVPSGNVVIEGEYARVLTAHEIVDWKGDRYVSHFAVCPKAKTWRGKHR